jgi:hypothetical protein
LRRKKPAFVRSVRSHQTSKLKESIMKKAVVVAVLLLLGGLYTQTQSSSRSGLPKVLEFNTMFGVTAPFLGATNAIQGVPGAGAAWKNPTVAGELKADGELEIQVRGLVLVATGANPAATFRGIVSCRSIDTTTDPPTPTTVVVVTGAFPATTTGNANIEDTVALPSPCIAPIVFVGPGTDPVRWFSATGMGTN